MTALLDVSMSMSPTIGAIAKALAKAQSEMRPALKDAQNPHFRNTYASLASAIYALQPFFANGIAVLQPPELAGPDGVTVSTLLLHESGEWIRGSIYMPASKKDAQGFGSALSYARRYCLMSTTGLAADDDDGQQAVVTSPVPSPSLEKKLEASVDWGLWEEPQVVALRTAQTPGELLEVWSAMAPIARGAPPGTLKRLTAIKDERKKTLAVQPAEAGP